MHGSAQIMRHELLAPVLDEQICGRDPLSNQPVIEERFIKARHRQADCLMDTINQLLARVVQSPVPPGLFLAGELQKYSRLLYIHSMVLVLCPIVRHWTIL